MRATLWLVALFGVAVAVALFPVTGDYHLMATAILWVAVALTWVSGAQYLLDGRGAATRLGHRVRPLPETA